MRWKRNFSLLRQLLYHAKCFLSIVFRKNLQKTSRKRIFPYGKRDLTHSSNHCDISNYAKATKITTTNRAKIYHPIFCTKILAKNRAKWIFTNLRQRCIIEFPIRQPIRVGTYPCTACWFLAKYQSNDIRTHLKPPVVLFLCFSLDKRRGFPPFFAIFRTSDIYYIVQIVKIIEKGWKFLSRGGIMI